jgi:hypothetical protein
MGTICWRWLNYVSRKMVNHYPRANVLLRRAQLIANGGNNENLFRAAMGDSPSMSFVPAFNEDYDVTIFNDYASFA